MDGNDLVEFSTIFDNLNSLEDQKRFLLTEVKQLRTKIEWFVNSSKFNKLIFTSYKEKVQSLTNELRTCKNIENVNTVNTVNIQECKEFEKKYYEKRSQQDKSEIQLLKYRNRLLEQILKRYKNKYKNLTRKTTYEQIEKEFFQIKKERDYYKSKLKQSNENNIDLKLKIKVLKKFLNKKRNEMEKSCLLLNKLNSVYKESILVDRI